MTKVRLCFHDRCFDGTASAALFYRFYREQFEAKAEFQFTGMTHKAKQPVGGQDLFDGDENVIVDFKYSNSPKLTWWFDHHQSAFLTPADAEYFKRFPGKHMFYEPEYKSCTKLIATVAKEEIRIRYQAAGRLDSLGRHYRWRAVSDAAIGYGADGAGDTAGAGDRSGAGKRNSCADYSGACVSAAGGNGEVAARGEASGAAAGEASQVD